MPEVLRVALPLPRPGWFDYLPVRDEPVDASWIGCRVWVPFGRTRQLGIVCAIGPSTLTPDRLRPIQRRVDAETLFTDELWRTLHWLADYYCAPLGEVAQLALPASLRRGEALAETGDVLYRCLESPRLRRGGQPERLWQWMQAAPRNAAALDLHMPDWRATVRGWIRRGAMTAEPTDYAPPAPRPAAFDLDEAQRQAVAQIDASSGFVAFLLHGVTGSGKTEVYLDALAARQAEGRQSLVLVPEIALTPQTERRFRARFGDAVLVWHSGIADGERARTFAALRAGEPRIVVGTRSAIFLPLPRPGLIIVDEEHDASYKQQDGVRYSARDLALVRARALDVPVVLGSATPSLEGLNQVARGRYRLLTLERRAAGASPPEVRVVDLRRQQLDAGLVAESVAAIEHTLGAGGQVLVFRNRRGFAPALLCHDCGWTAACDRCDRPMTVHGGGRRLICHHCGARSHAPEACPDCHGLALQSQGVGTERLEQALRARFPDVPVLRFDRDSTRGRDAVSGLLAELADRPGILIGTQMLAKGHDLPRLDLVVVVGIDEGLFSADFRASERLSQLLIQVSGRAGRSRRRGRVLLQTHHPQHPLLVTLLQGGYPAFAEAALVERALLGLPPAAHLALLRAEAQQPEHAEDFLRRAAQLLAASTDGPAVSGPMPAPHPRRAGFHRLQLVLSAETRAPLHAALDAVWPALFDLPEARRVRWSVDVDPLDLY